MRKKVLVCFLMCVALSGCGKKEVENLDVVAPNVVEDSSQETIEQSEAYMTEEETSSLQLPENCIPQEYETDQNITGNKNLIFGNYYFGEEGHQNDRMVADTLNELYGGYSKEVSGFGTVYVYINKIYMLDKSLDSYIADIKDEGSWIYTLTDKETDHYPEIPDNALQYGDIIVVQPDYWVFLYAYKLENGGYMEVRMGVPINNSSNTFSTPDNVENEFSDIVEALLESENANSLDLD